MHSSAETCTQQPGRAQGLKQRMKMLLLEHYRKSGKQKPQVLIWYRDGVSEGQFPECSKVEVRLRDAVWQQQAQLWQC